MGCIYSKDDITLKPFDYFSSDDLSKYKEWMQDLEVTKYNSHGLFPKMYNEINDFIEGAIYSKKQVTWQIYYKEEFIGMCSLQGINWINRSGEVAIYVGEKSLWGKGISRTAVKFMLMHGFERLGLNRIWSGTASKNIGMNKIFTQLGFVKEGVFVDGAFLNGEFEDINSYALLRYQYD